jgi:hypothetical protein
VVYTQTPLPAGALLAPYAQCPVGKKATGGGWFGPGTDEVIIKQMEPWANGGGFSVIVQSVVNYESYIRVTVTCAIAN